MRGILMALTSLVIVATQARGASLNEWEFKHENIDLVDYCGMSALTNSGLFTINISSNDSNDLKVSIVNQSISETIPNDLHPKFVLSFDNGDSLDVTGTKGSLDVNTALQSAQVRKFIHDFTAAHTMNIAIGAQNGFIGTWPLVGTTPAVTAMGECTKSYIDSPPAPFVGRNAVQTSVAPPTDSPDLPKTLGSCVFTTVKDVENRLSDDKGPVAGSGSAIALANSGYQVSYDQVPQLDTSHSGDRVMMCLVKLPTNCPKGDDRGKVYTTTNLRTLESWTLGDSEHACGGA